MQAYVYQRVAVSNQIVHGDLGVVSDLESAKYAKKTVKSVLYRSTTKNVAVVSAIYRETLLMVVGYVRIYLQLQPLHPLHPLQPRYHHQSTKKVSTATNTTIVVIENNAIATINVLVASSLQLFVYKIKTVVLDNVDFIKYLKQ
jgi:uncharacterized protein (UPF0254 family)